METLQSLSPSLSINKSYTETRLHLPLLFLQKFKHFCLVNFITMYISMRVKNNDNLNIEHPLTLYIHWPKNTSSTTTPLPLALSPSHIIKNSLQLLQLMVSLIQCSSHSRDATVSLISAATIKPFDPHHSWHVPKFHSDITSSFTCRWWRWRWWWWCGR